jgi:hypothetical protein
VTLGIAIPKTFFDGRVDPRRLQDFLRRADALGFHSAWVVEQILGSSATLVPIELLTYAAAVTERVRLGAAVLLTALRTRVHTAKSLATLDQLSGGRLIVGVGLGGNPQIYPRWLATNRVRILDGSAVRSQGPQPSWHPNTTRQGRCLDSRPRLPSARQVEPDDESEPDDPGQRSDNMMA